MFIYFSFSVLEYAPGGELFDFILRHKYLKERDACRLFAQLISGVWYLHKKKVVHRDLKLENLLLDRGRNIIITDFGFANRFENRVDDLMATSCGSPCYAAPELVISDGLYVGSAVDIWSCGVILYAMLAGYLPFDDDPQNPEGDNINLLYKYIVSTPLTFPDFVSLEARNLLSMMLVPDPTKRCSIEDIMVHPWLKSYSHLFDRNVQQWEKLSQDLLNAKRIAQKRQLQAFELERLAPTIIRSQTEANPNLFPSMTSKNTRHQSAMGVPVSTSSYQQPLSSLSPVDYLQKANQDATNEYLQYQNRQSDLNKSSSQSKKREAPDNQINSSNGSKRNVQRHTIQVEYENNENDQSLVNQDQNVKDDNNNYDTNLLSPQVINDKSSQISTPPLKAAEEANVNPLNQVSSVPMPTTPILANDTNVNDENDDNNKKKVKRETAPPITTNDHHKKQDIIENHSREKLSDKSNNNYNTNIKSEQQHQQPPPISSGALKMMNKTEDDKLSNSSKRSSGGTGGSKDSRKTSSGSVSGRRKALSLIVEPFGKSSANKDRNKAVSQVKNMKENNDVNNNNNNTIETRERKISAAFLHPSFNSKNNLSERPPASTTSPPSVTYPNVAGTTFDNAAGVGPQSHKGSSSRAKSVMNWFRNKGLAKNSGVVDVSQQTTPQQQQQQSTQSKPQSQFKSQQQSQQQQKIEKPTTNPPTATIKTRPSTAGASISVSNRVTEDAMDTHTGTVDQNALTALPPSVAMNEVRRVITQDLGLIIKKETTVSIKCVRPKKQLSQINQQQPLLNSNSGGLRSLLMFKRSSSQSTALSSSTGVQTNVNDESSNTIYGEPQVDSAGEVILDVKLTKIKNLPGYVL